MLCETLSPTTRRKMKEDRKKIFHSKISFALARLQRCLKINKNKNRFNFLNENFRVCFSYDFIKRIEFMLSTMCVDMQCVYILLVSSLLFRFKSSFE